MTDPVHALQPDPLEPEAGEVERYVVALQELAASDPRAARREAWRQIRLAGARAGRRRAEVLDTLARMFKLGTPPEPALDGPYRGLVVATTTVQVADRLSHTVSGLWMPWVGKRFDARAASGFNVVEPSARIPFKLLWPAYRPGDAGDAGDAGDGNLSVFAFRTYTDQATLDPDRQVLRIDYDCADNPGFLIRDLVDELVQVVPGAYLGKALLRRGGRAAPRWQLAGYFALEPPESVRAAEPAFGAAAPAPA